MVNHYRLSEKLKDLRRERNLKLEDVVVNIIVDGVPISIHTLQRLEDTDKSYNAGYKEIAELAKFYGVSTDYLMDMTDNRNYKLIGINELSLSDEAIEILNSKKLNNRLISELLAYPDFQQLLSAIEVYIDKKVLPQMNMMNAIYKVAEQAIKENYKVEENDEVMAFLQQSVIDEDEYLRYRISERFNDVMKGLFELHKKDSLPKEQTDVMNELNDYLQIYMDDRAKVGDERAKANLLLRQMGMNPSELSDEEVIVLTKAFEKSTLFKRTRGKM